MLDILLHQKSARIMPPNAAHHRLDKWLSVTFSWRELSA